jgi:hypothetical protein
MALPLLVPLALAVALFAPATLGGKVISGGRVALYWPPYSTPAEPLPPADVLQSDSGFVFEPDGLIVRRALREGRLPIWTPAMSAGLPLLADQQSAPLFPLTWIGVLLPYDWSRAWINVLKLVLAALGTYLLARALALRRGPALLGGVSYGFAAYLVIWLLHPHANAYAVLPWLLLAADRLCERGTVRDAALLGLALGIAFLGGQPESGLIVSLVTAAWVIHRLIGARPARGELARRILLGVAAAVLGGAGGGDAAAAARGHPSGHQQLALAAAAARALDQRAVLPEVLGDPRRGAGQLRRAHHVRRRAAAAARGRRPRGAAPARPQLFFAGLAVVSFAVALDTGPFSHAVHNLPVLDQAALARVLILASFAIAMLAAFGLQLLLTGTAAERRRMLIAASVVAVLPALVVVGAHPQWLGVLPDGVKRVFGAGAETVDAIALASVLRWLAFAAAAIAVLAALVRWRHRTTLLIAAAIGLAAIDLLTLTAGYNPAISRAEAAPPQPPAVAALRRLTSGGGRVVGVQAMQPNTASRWGLEDARGHEQPTVGRVALLWTVLGGGAELNAPGVNLQDPRAQKLLDVFGVRAILLQPSALADSPLRDAPVEYSGPGGAVVSNPSALPPAFVAYGWRASPGRTASAFLAAAGTPRQARDAPVIETAEKPPAATPGAATPARVVSRSDTEVTLGVQAKTDGHVVLLDTFYPGWHAEVDGRERPIRAADLAFRAVAVTPGRHTVRFFYRPASVIAGGGLSLAALLAIVVCLIGARRRRIRSSDTE